MDKNLNLLLYGTPDAPPEKVHLRAGPLRLFFENGDLRSIRLGNQEIIRRIYVAVRGAIWDTIPLRLSNVTISTEEDAFSITFRAHHLQLPIDFSWQGTITGDHNGNIRFTLEGQANTTFLRNRIGFCVLHPIAECAGQPCEIETVTGEIFKGHFPKRISPHQPFKKIRAIRHAVLPGVTAEVHLEGETFEMEDQRNWADASYKIYSTPLDLPKPVEIRAGTRIKQSVKIFLDGWQASEHITLPTSTHEREIAVKTPGFHTQILNPSSVTIQVDTERVLPLPALGLSVTESSAPLLPAEIEQLRALRLSHLRAEVHLSRLDHLHPLNHALAQARALQIPLELALYFSDDSAPLGEKVNSLAQTLQAAGVRIARLLVFDEVNLTTPERWVDAGRRLAGVLGAPIPVGGGSRVYFTELNRFPPPFDRLDVVSYSVNTQVHAVDHTSQVENTAGIGETVRSAHHLSGGKPLSVGPITLRPRFDPHFEGAQPATLPGKLPYSVDARQASLLGAAWTLGCLQSLVESGAESVTFFETIGWKGVLAGEAGSPLPDLFPHLPGMVFPLYHVLEGMAAFKGAQALATRTSGVGLVFALALRKPRKLRLMLGNGCNQAREVGVTGLTGKATLRRLDETSAPAAMRDPQAFWLRTDQELEFLEGGVPLYLMPFAIHFLDFAI